MSDIAPIPSNARVIKPAYDNRGRPEWRSRMSPPDNTFALCFMVPDRIIPVIFVPGVMGSNLVERVPRTEQAVRWRMDGISSATDWAGPSSNAAFRKRHLIPAAMEVDNQGAVPNALELPAEELRRRGWGEIAAMSYGPTLRWLEQQLNDFDTAHTGERVKLLREALGAELGEAALTHDQAALSYKYRFPVYACGYNWLDDNATSARRLAARIDEIRQRYAKDQMKCDKVILVTHSMGGLVARHCSEVLGYRDKIFGIVHGVMPAIGAAAVYRRFKSGTEDPTAWYNAAGAVTASVLGNDAAEMTAVLSSAPGPLQLLPTAEYGNGWLKVRDGNAVHSLPKNGDPYGEIYTVRGKWWSMCEDHLVNPLNEEKDPARRKAQMDADWAAYADLLRKVEDFHRRVAGRYHPNTHAFYGSHASHRAYGTVTWTLRSGRTYMAPGDVLNGTLASTSQTGTERTVRMMAPAPASVRGAAPGASTMREEARTFGISEPDENGDGTVPHRSGVAPKPHCKAFLCSNVGHEPAYNPEKEGEQALRNLRFTLRAIVQIAQDVKQTALRYE